MQSAKLPLTGKVKFKSEARDKKESVTYQYLQRFIPCQVARFC